MENKLYSILMIKFKHPGFKLATLRGDSDSAKLIYVKSVFRTLHMQDVADLKYFKVILDVMSSLYLVVDPYDISDAYYTTNKVFLDATDAPSAHNATENIIVNKILQYNTKKYQELLKTPDNPVCIWFISEIANHQ